MIANTLSRLPGIEAYLRLDGNVTDEVGASAWTGGNLTYTTSLVHGDADDQAATFNGSSSELWVDTAYGAYSSVDGFAIGCLAATTNDADDNVLFGMGNSGGATNPRLMVITQGGNLRVFLSDAGGTTAIDQTGTVDFDSGRPFSCVFTMTAAGAWTLYVDGKSELSGTISKPAITFNRASFGCLRRDVTSASFSGQIDECFITSEALTQANIDAIQRSWLPYIKLDGTDEHLMRSADFLTQGSDTYAKFAVDMPAARLALGMVGRRGDSTTMAVRIDNSPTASSLAISDARVFGAGPDVTRYMAGQQTAELAGGLHTITVINQTNALNPWEGLLVTAGDAGGKFAGAVVDAWGGPLAAEYGGDLYSVSSALFSDERYIQRHKVDGTKESIQFAGPFRVNDVNHAGVGIARFSGGVLAAATGHSDPTCNVSWVPNGVLADKADYTIGGATSRLSYPQPIALPDGRAYIAFRGTFGANNESTRNPLHYICNAADGTGGLPETFADLGGGGSGDMRAHPLKPIAGLGTDGKTYVANAWSVREEPAQNVWALCVAIYCVEDDLWYNAEGTQLGGSSPGTTASPRISQALFLTAQGSGGCLVIERTGGEAGTEELASLGHESVAFDVSQMPAKCKAFMPYTVAPDGDPQGTHDQASTIGTLTVDGSTITDHGALSLPDPVLSSYCGGSVTLRSSGVADMILIPHTRIDNTGFDDEPLQTYYKAFRGGDVVYTYEVTNPFTTSPTFTLKRQESVPETAVVQFSSVPGTETLYAGLSRLNAHPVHSRRDVMFYSRLDATWSKTNPLENDVSARFANKYGDELDDWPTEADVSGENNGRYVVENGRFRPADEVTP